METEAGKHHPDEKSQSQSQSTLIFMGTGSSSGVPYARCLIQPSDPPCSVCFSSMSLPPERNPNYRCNTSLFIDYCCPRNGDQHKYILIDAGKTFREQVLRWFMFYKIPYVDSVLLTHDHADAVLGLDDIRCVQQYRGTKDARPIPVYATQGCIDRESILMSFSSCNPEAMIDWDKAGDCGMGSGLRGVSLKFPYLFKERKDEQMFRRVPWVEWKEIEGNCERPFIASGLEFHPLPVMHGEDYVALGFLFGGKCKVAYISDVSRFPPTTERVISKHEGMELDLLILDSCSIILTETHNTHLCFPEALDAVKRICPKRALLTGLSHNYDHDKINVYLHEWSKREGIPVQLAHDGLRIPMEL